MELQAAPIPEPTVEEPVQQAKPAQPQAVAEEIEELEELEPKEKRRRKNKLIIDKKIILPSNYFRARLENVAVELRCETSSDDIVDLRVPWEILSARPAAAGGRAATRLARSITKLFLERAGLAHNCPLEHQDMEVALTSRSRRTQLPPLEVIPEEPPALEPQAPQIELPMEEARLDQSAVAPDLRPSVGQDISELLTQKLDVTAKRASQEDGNVPKRQRTTGVMSFRQHQLSQERYTQQQQDYDINDKENIPDNRQSIPEIEVATEIQIITSDPEQRLIPASDPEHRLNSMLQAAGLADMEFRPETTNTVEEGPPRKISRRQGSESSETMLGSLDRTRVSLGDSEHTTDSKRFIRDQWGTEGTMVKILHLLKARAGAATVDALLARGPLLPRCRRHIAARCFTSILKLKQHGFIKVQKDPETLEIVDILLGPKFDNM